MMDRDLNEALELLTPEEQDEWNLWYGRMVEQIMFYSETDTELPYITIH